MKQRTSKNIEKSIPVSVEELKTACESEKLRLTQETDQSIAICSPKGRYAKKAIGLIIFGIVWNCIVGLLFILEVPLQSVIIITLFDLILVFMIVDFLCNSTILLLVKDRLIIKNQGLIFRKTVELRSEQIIEIVTDGDIQIAFTLYYRICLQLRNSKKYILLRKIAQIEEANVIVRFLKSTYEL